LRELDVNNLLKVIRNKTDLDEFTKEKSYLDGKILTQEEVLTKLKKDFDSLNQKFI
jgi:flagellar capping protein FliD